MEDRIAALEKLLTEKIAEYDLQIARAQAPNEIAALMGKYALYYSAQQYHKCAELWAKRDDSSVDVGGGAAIGYEDAVVPDYSINRVDPVGRFRIHTFSTPAIVVAGDGQTARGTWFSPGVDTDVKDDGNVSCEWCWIKYGVDFIKEDGVWKIWHLTAYGAFHTDYYTSWGDKEPQPLFREMPKEDGEKPKPPKDGIHGGPGPNARHGRRRADWTYAKDRKPVLEPVPAEPYETWDDVEGEGYCHL